VANFCHLGERLLAKDCRLGVMRVALLLLLLLLMMMVDDDDDDDDGVTGGAV